MRFSSLILTLSTVAAGFAQPASQAFQSRVMQNLRSLPALTVHDDVRFIADAQGNVTLMGATPNARLKQDAEQAVAKVPGARIAANRIEVVPGGATDAEIRLATARAIYGDPVISRYGTALRPAIRILVRNGHVTLAGDVPSTLDRQVAAARAAAVPGVTRVVNELNVSGRPVSGH